MAVGVTIEIEDIEALQCHASIQRTLRKCIVVVVVDVVEETSCSLSASNLNSFGKHSHPPLLIVWLGNPNSDADVGSLRRPRRRRGVMEILDKSVSPHVFAVLWL